MAKIFATTDPNVSPREIENGERSRKIAPQGMVLLENNGVLPLRGKPGKIALYGNGARRTIKGGTGSGDVNTRETVNIEQGLEAAGFEIVTKAWIDRDCANVDAANAAYYDHLKQLFAEKGKAAFMEMFSNPFIPPAMVPVEEEDLHPDQADTAIFVIARNSGEGKDRNDLPGEYEPFEEEIASLRRVAAAYAKTVVVLNVGGVIDMKAILAVEGVDAVLNMSQAGNYGGYALADALTGKQAPSGRLATTWAENYADYPASDTFSHCNGDLDDEYYTESIFVGYRYFDTFNVTPRYPFGYGLSYTAFAWECVECAADEKEVCVRVKVTNTGSFADRQVIQVYASAPAGKLEKPYQELRGYAKTAELAPGASEILTVRFATADLASYSPEKAAWVLEPGTYYIRAGVHSRDTKVVLALRLDKEAVTVKVKNLMPLDCEMKLLSSAGAVPFSYPAEAEEKAAAKVVDLSAAAFETRTVAYAGPAAEIPKTDKAFRITLEDVRSGKATLEEMVSQLTPFEMATLCVGTSRGNFLEGGPQIGASSAACPGAAGDTTSLLLEDRGVRNLILPDGPAGLRLTPHFKVDGEGRIYPMGSPFPGAEFLTAGMPKPEIPADAKDYYQYTTAIPIATLLAQTWDDRAVEEAGDIVGGEMELFGSDLWLAPGMNIHRNPLCGRNFEYYSEDPLVAGRCAAADTRGVQKHRSAGTTIKHFALNNQEDNRNHVNAHVDERALREIYLKGFEICIRTAHPYSIMTSYNLLNGEHTANKYDLISAFARDECGFDGIVMTDWGTTGYESLGSGSDALPAFKYGNSYASGCVKAGNDLTMPGSEGDVNDILGALGKKPGEVPYPLTLGELQAAAFRMLSLILRMER